MEILRKICSFASVIVGFYSTLILVRIIVSWAVMIKRRGGWNMGAEYGFNPQEGPSFLDSADSFLGKLCDPYLGMFRGVKSLRRSTLDFTPVLALVLLNLLKSVLSMIAKMDNITVWIVIAIILDGLWSSLISFLLILLLILLIVRFFLGRSATPGADNLINSIDPILDAPVGRVYKIFFRKTRVDDQKLVLTSIIFYAVIYFALKFGIQALVKFLIKL